MPGLQRIVIMIIFSVLEYVLSKIITGTKMAAIDAHKGLLLVEKKENYSRFRLKGISWCKLWKDSGELSQDVSISHA